LKSDITKNTVKMASLKAQVENVEKGAQVRISSLDNEVLAKAKQVKVAAAEIEAVAKLKSELVKNGLDIDTIMKVAKEFGYAKKH